MQISNLHTVTDYFWSYDVTLQGYSALNQKSSVKQFQANHMSLLST